MEYKLKDGFKTDLHWELLVNLFQHVEDFMQPIIWFVESRELFSGAFERSATCIGNSGHAVDDMGKLVGVGCSNNNCRWWLISEVVATIINSDRIHTQISWSLKSNTLSNKIQTFITSPALLQCCKMRLPSDMNNNKRKPSNCLKTSQLNHTRKLKHFLKYNRNIEISTNHWMLEQSHECYCSVRTNDVGAHTWIITRGAVYSGRIKHCLHHFGCFLVRSHLTVQHFLFQTAHRLKREWKILFGIEH